MFERALLMKVDSSLNIEDYVAVLYPPSVIFDKDTIVADERGLQLVHKLLARSYGLFQVWKK